MVDSQNAANQADFWAAALEYEVEDPSALVEQLLGTGELPAEASAVHHSRATFRGFAAIRHPDDPFDSFSGVGHGRRLLFQDVSEPKAAKNRLHVDVHSGPHGLAHLMDRLERLGATRVREVDHGAAGHWWVMRDPEGNEFCAA